VWARFVRLCRVKRIAEAAAAHLATHAPDDVPITADEVVRLLARIARTGPVAARLRAIELLGARMGLFQEAPAVEPAAALSDEERAERIGAILDRARLRREVAQGQGNPAPVVPEEQH
jgi:hypothetical protein